VKLVVHLGLAAAAAAAEVATAAAAAARLVSNDRRAWAKRACYAEAQHATAMKESQTKQHDVDCHPCTRKVEAFYHWPPPSGCDTTFDLNSLHISQQTRITTNTTT
jgi:hypothetical protein